MSEGISISVDPNAINEYIAAKIIDSAIGERLKETVDQALKSLGSYGNDPLKSAVTSEVNKYVMELVRTEFSEQIKTAVRTAMTPEFINKLTEGYVASITTKIDRF